MKRYNKGDKVVSKKYFDIDINGYLTQICEGDIGTVDWDSGEPEIDVYFGDYVRLSVRRQDIEPYNSEPEEEVKKIYGWVAIDEAFDSCFLHTLEPHQESQGIADTGDYYTVWESDGETYLLDKGLFPNMDSESDPVECELTITIKPKKK